MLGVLPLLPCFPNININKQAKERHQTAFTICAVQLLRRLKDFFELAKKMFMKRVFHFMYMENMDPFQHTRQNTIISFASKLCLFLNGRIPLWLNFYTLIAPTPSICNILGPLCNVSFYLKVSSFYQGMGEIKTCSTFEDMVKIIMFATFQEMGKIIRFATFEEMIKIITFATFEEMTKIKTFARYISWRHATFAVNAKLHLQ